MADRVKMEIEQLWEQTSARLRSYIYCLCGDGTEADDLLQESYLRALRNWKQFDGRGSRGGWLFGIARRTCIDWYRRNKNRAAESLEGLDEARLAVKEEKPSDKIEMVWQAANGLNDECRQIIYLRFAGELGYREIAEVLDIPIGTVRSRLHRALKQLRERLR